MTLTAKWIYLLSRHPSNHCSTTYSFLTKHLPQLRKGAAARASPLLHDDGPFFLQCCLQVLRLQKELVHSHAVLSVLLLFVSLQSCKFLCLTAQPKGAHVSTIKHERLFNPSLCERSVLTRLSSKRLLSSSHFSKDVCRSCSSPSREVTWALRASLSLVSCKIKIE